MGIFPYGSLRFYMGILVYLGFGCGRHNYSTSVSETFTWLLYGFYKEFYMTGFGSVLWYMYDGEPVVRVIGQAATPGTKCPGILGSGLGVCFGCGFWVSGWDLGI